jgi:hypothetical protein
MSIDTVPKLPPEIVDAFIDQVHEDLFVEVNTNLLGTCSLVSKSWLPRSRQHLFQRVVIPKEEGAMPFLDLLYSPFCTIKPYVQILELEEGGDNNPIWLGDGLPMLSNLLPAVWDLSIEGGRFAFPDLISSLASFQNLRDLTLMDCVFNSLSQLFGTLSLCTSLQKLFLSSLDVNNLDVSSAVNSSPPPLRFADLHEDIPLNDILKWLTSGEHVSIETLELFSIQEHQIVTTTDCLRALGPSLKVLKLGFPIISKTYISCQGSNLESIVPETFYLP